MFVSNFHLLRIITLSVCVALAIPTLVRADAVNPASVIIDFDYDAQGLPLVGASYFLSAGSASLSSLYTPLGVTFSGSRVNTGGVIVNQQAGSFTVPTRSGANFLAFSEDKYAHGPEVITFTSPVSSVTIYATSPGTSRFTMDAYNSAGLPVGSTTVFALENVLDSFKFNYYPLTITTSALLPIYSVVLTQQSIDPLDNVIYEYDDLTFTPLALTSPNAVVSGRIALEGVANLTQTSPVAPISDLTITLRTPGTTAIHYVYNVPVTPSGSGSAFAAFALNVPYGTYDLAIKNAKSLRSLVSNVVVSGPVTLPDILLAGGDANNDNSVDTSDFSLLVGSYGGDSNVPGTGYDQAEDFNYDGIVDTSDFDLLVGEYGNSGAN